MHPPRLSRTGSDARALVAGVGTHAPRRRAPLHTDTGEPELFRYYAASGYAPVFGCSRALFTASEGSITDQTVTPERSDKYSEDIYRYLNRKLRERPYCVQHTEEDFKVVLADLRLSRGTVYTLRQDRKIVALAVAVPEEEGARVEEAVAETPALRRLLLQHICEDLRLPALRTTAPPEEGIPATPLGMARIINAHAFLQRYAALHPALEMNILLSDPQLSANNGYYYLTGGKCLYCDTRLPGKHLTLDIGGLAGELLSPLRPYMSLMMN